ncbi:hypothetical protein ACHQM5_019479 [Ranunculus cassubicifolius]
MEFNYCSCPSLLFLLILSISYLSSSSIQQEKTIPEVNIDNPVLHFTPYRLDGLSPIKGSRDMSCERVRIVGRSMFNIKSFANVLRVNLTPSVAIPERLHNKIEVCIHRNASLGLCQCEEWRTVQKGQWSVSMSPYENRYVDVKLMNGTSGVITVAVEEDFQRWRLYFLVIGFVLLLVAPILSDWVPFYYTSSMAVGVLLVVLILLFQGMKLLPTGRKSAIYFTIYGSLVGLGSYIVHYFSMLISSILVSFGLSEEMYSPVSLLVGLGVILSGAALGYWAVRKYVISEDGSVDIGIANFVKWAIRIVATVSIFQSTLDDRLAVLALVFCWGISAGIKRLHTRLTLKKGTLWTRKNKYASGNRNTPEFLSRSGGKGFGRSPWASPRKPIPYIISPTRGYVSPSPLKGSMSMTPETERDYFSTIHKVPNRKRWSKKEWAEFTEESTKEAMAEMVSSPEFTDWVVENADRIQLQREESDDDVDSDEVMSEETVIDSANKIGLFGW